MSTAVGWYQNRKVDANSFLVKMINVNKVLIKCSISMALLNYSTQLLLYVFQSQQHIVSYSRLIQLFSSSVASPSNNRNVLTPKGRNLVASTNMNSMVTQ